MRAFAWLAWAISGTLWFFMGEPWAYLVAAAVYLLCLPEANMINGHTLVVDGGYCISG